VTPHLIAIAQSYLSYNNPDEGSMVCTSELKLNEIGELQSWLKPATSKFGLYVFRASSEIIRVGETSSGCARISKGFKQPLRRSLRGKVRKNYLAYSWREKFPNTSIWVDFFDLMEDPFSDSYLRRSLEAEITFQLRIHMKHWPREMSEIHFQERSRLLPSVVEQANSVLQSYGYQYRADI
jgi:hypothetical protein